MSELSININSKVSVRLTKFGAEHVNSLIKERHRREEEDLDIITTVKRPGDIGLYEEGDLYTSVLWRLFKAFDEAINQGGEIPFKDNDIKVHDFINVGLKNKP